MCGYGVQKLPVSYLFLAAALSLLTPIYLYFKASEASKKIWTTGCVEEVRVWLERNLYTIASVALGVALAQVQN